MIVVLAIVILIMMGVLYDDYIKRKEGYTILGMGRDREESEREMKNRVLLGVPRMGAVYMDRGIEYTVSKGTSMDLYKFVNMEGINMEVGITKDSNGMYGVNGSYVIGLVANREKANITEIKQEGKQENKQDKNYVEVVVGNMGEQGDVRFIFTSEEGDKIPGIILAKEYIVNL